jgi:hypothetical protein
VDRVSSTLSGMKVGLSGAMPDPEDLEKMRWSEWDIRAAVHLVAEAVVVRGGQIIHGNHPTYIHLIREAIRRLTLPSRNQFKPVKIYVVAPFLTGAEADEFRKEHGSYAEIEFVGPYFDPKWGKQDVQEKRLHWLQVMREKMASYIDALVCIGGKGVRPDVPHPGVEVEASLTALAGKPFYIAAALGGFAQNLHYEKILSDPAQKPEAPLPKEVIELRNTADPGRITELVLSVLTRKWSEHIVN